MKYGVERLTDSFVEKATELQKVHYYDLLKNGLKKEQT